MNAHLIRTTVIYQRLASIPLVLLDALVMWVTKVMGKNAPVGNLSLYP